MTKKRKLANQVQSYVGKHNYFTYRAKSYSRLLENLIDGRSTTTETKFLSRVAYRQLNRIIKSLKERKD